MGFYGIYPLAIEHDNGKSPMNGGFNGKISDQWSSFQHAMFDDRRVHEDSNGDSNIFQPSISGWWFQPL